MKLKKEKKVQKDLALYEQIQPLGGIHFKEDRYITSGTGYESCLTVVDFPTTLQDYWLQKVTKLDDVVAVVDIATENPTVTKANINRSMKEQNQRARTNDYEERKEAEQRKRELDLHYNEISKYEQVLKIVQPRIFVPGDSKEEIDKKAGELQKKLKTPGYKTAVFLGETQREWKSIFQSYTEQQTYSGAIYGQPLTAEALAYGNPFWFSALYDPHGIPLGTTPSGGDVMFDPGHITDHRTHYSGAVVGNPGSGKTTLLKKLIKSLAIRGHYIRIFDIVGDYKELGKELGFKEVTYGKDGIINILHIYKGGDTEPESYAKHVTKVSTFYSCLNPEASAKEIALLEDQLAILYQKKGIDIEGQVTGFATDRYPILQDLAESVAEEIEKLSEEATEMNEAKKQIMIQNLLILDNIKTTLYNAVKTYGVFINGATSIENLQEEQLVDFNITALKDVKSTVFDACIECLFSLTWDNMISNGAIMKRKFENGEVKKEDIVRFFTFVDESHNWINVNKPFMVEECIRYSKEARKYFGGFWYVFHKASDVLKGDMGITSMSADARDKLNALFTLTQYKFVFAQGKEDMALLQKLFGNTFTPFQCARIPTLGKGQNVFCISGLPNILMKVALSKEEEQLFRGGV